MSGGVNPTITKGNAFSVQGTPALAKRVLTTVAGVVAATFAAVVPAMQLAGMTLEQIAAWIQLAAPFVKFIPVVGSAVGAGVALINGAIDSYTLVGLYKEKSKIDEELAGLGEILTPQLQAQKEAIEKKIRLVWVGLAINALFFCLGAALATTEALLFWTGFPIVSLALSVGFAIGTTARLYLLRQAAAVETEDKLTFGFEMLKTSVLARYNPDNRAHTTPEEVIANYVTARNLLIESGLGVLASERLSELEKNKYNGEILKIQTNLEGTALNEFKVLLSAIPTNNAEDIKARFTEIRNTIDAITLTTTQEAQLTNTQEQQYKTHINALRTALMNRAQEVVAAQVLESNREGATPETIYQAIQRGEAVINGMKRDASELAQLPEENQVGYPVQIGGMNNLLEAARQVLYTLTNAELKAIQSRIESSGEFSLMQIKEKLDALEKNFPNPFEPAESLGGFKRKTEGLRTAAQTRLQKLRRCNGKEFALWYADELKRNSFERKHSKLEEVFTALLEVEFTALDSGSNEYHRAETLINELDALAKSQAEAEKGRGDSESANLLSSEFAGKVTAARKRLTQSRQRLFNQLVIRVANPKEVFNPQHAEDQELLNGIHAAPLWQGQHKAAVIAYLMGAKDSTNLFFRPDLLNAAVKLYEVESPAGAALQANIEASLAAAEAELQEEEKAVFEETDGDSQKTELDPHVQEESLDISLPQDSENEESGELIWEEVRRGVVKPFADASANSEAEFDRSGSGDDRTEEMEPKVETKTNNETVETFEEVELEVETESEVETKEEAETESKAETGETTTVVPTVRFEAASGHLLSSAIAAAAAVGKENLTPEVAPADLSQAEKDALFADPIWETALNKFVDQLLPADITATKEQKEEMVKLLKAAAKELLTEEITGVVSTVKQGISNSSTAAAAAVLLAGNDLNKGLTEKVDSLRKKVKEGREAKVIVQRFIDKFVISNPFDPESVNKDSLVRFFTIRESIKDISTLVNLKSFQSSWFGSAPIKEYSKKHQSMLDKYKDIKGDIATAYDLLSLSKLPDSPSAKELLAAVDAIKASKNQKILNMKMMKGIFGTASPLDQLQGLAEAVRDVSQDIDDASKVLVKIGNGITDNSISQLCVAAINYTLKLQSGSQVTAVEFQKFQEFVLYLQNEHLQVIKNSVRVDDKIRWSESGSFFGGFIGNLIGYGGETVGTIAYTVLIALAAKQGEAPTPIGQSELLMKGCVREGLVLAGSSLAATALIRNRSHSFSDMEQLVTHLDAVAGWIDAKVGPVKSAIQNAASPVEVAGPPGVESDRLIIDE